MTTRKPKTWLITGADKGLGQSAAKAALERGDRVVVTVLAADGSHSLTSQFPQTLRSLHLDAKDHARVGVIVNRAEQAFSGIDILLNNAGFGLVALAEETGADKYRPLFEANFFGLAEMTRAVLPGMRSRGSGHIINVSSLAGFGASAGFRFYCASKFAVEGYSESLAREVKHLGIRVTIVEPGGFRSDFAGRSLVSQPTSIEGYSAAGLKTARYCAERHGTQPNDPDKFSLALCRLADEENPPLRLPLGADALQMVRDEIAAVAADRDRWQELSLSTAFDS
jgi:NAD(P)-dependent dehydrogenase (short-subunit alcohol dehydrogenase family)